MLPTCGVTGLRSASTRAIAGFLTIAWGIRNTFFLQYSTPFLYASTTFDDATRSRFSGGWSIASTMPFW